MGQLRFRPASSADAEFAADVYTAVRPTAPVDPIVTRWEWDNAPDAWVVKYFVVERAGRPVGVASFDHPRWDRSDRRFGSVGGDLLPVHRSAESLNVVFAEMERRLAAAGAATFAVRANEDDALRIGVAVARGFREDRRSKRWELDLVANAERIVAMAQASRVRMRAEGVRLLTLAEDPDPEKVRKIWRMSTEAEQDVPTTLPHVEDTVEDYIRWFRSPGIRVDRVWLAREGDDIVGVSLLHYPPVRGVVGTAWTATARKVRGRGIARAVKCETLMQARSLDVGRVRTGNDAANDPILHINSSMGYRPIAGAINFLKDV